MRLRYLTDLHIAEEGAGMRLLDALLGARCECGCHPGKRQPEVLPCRERIRHGCDTLLCRFCACFAHHMHFTPLEVQEHIAMKDANPDWSILDSPSNWLK